MLLHSGKELIKQKINLCVEKTIIQKLESKIDMIQQSAWKTEDYIIKTLGMTEMNRSEIQEVKLSLSLINSKIESIETELRGIRQNGDE